MVGHRFEIFSITIERFSSGAIRLATISPTPNTPTATGTKPIPSASVISPKVKRCPPVLPSVPTSPSRRPNTIMATALTTDPGASPTAEISPSTISEKYSGAPKDWPTLASGGENSAISKVDTVPAQKEASAATASAAPARPWRALCAPARGGQAAGGRTAILGAGEDSGEHDQARHRLEIEGERQQHRDGRDRPDAGQHADQGADQAADEREAEIDRRARDAEAEDDVVEQVHVTTPARSRSAAQGPR